MNKKWIVGLLVLVLVTVACALPSIGAGGDSSVLFKDDFSSSSSGWYTNTDPDYVVAYDNGGYNIQVIADDIDAWGEVDQTLPADVSIEVDATQASGPEDSSYGILCRYQDTNNFYAFDVGVDGYVAIWRTVSGTTDMISGQEWTQSSAIKTGNVLNHLRVDCVGSTLTLYVNGTQVVSITDSSLISGGVGLIASTWGTGGANIVFDNFVVRKP